MQSKEVQNLLDAAKQQGYVGDTQLGVTLFLADLLSKPILLEGPAGVGKTEVAKVMSKIYDDPLLRLQCYEGIDANQAIYEWNYQKQLIYLKLAETEEKTIEEKEATIFSEDFLLERPLLKSIRSPRKQVLLIDEVDKSDAEFESFLLEFLSDWQISIPELGTMEALTKPRVVLTSNRTRDLSDALRRRCIYLWMDYPDLDKEIEIILTKVPTINHDLAQQIAFFLQNLRQEKLNKKPGISESIDWAKALSEMHIDHLDKEIVETTLGIILKDWKDVRETTLSLSELLEKTQVQTRIHE